MKLYTAEWCGMCKPIKAKIKARVEAGEIAEDHIEIVDVDTSKGEAEAMRLGIRALPTLVVDDNPDFLTNTNDIMELVNA